MKKFVAVVLVAICVAGCSKPKMGTYFTTLDGDVLNVELLSGDNCILYFSGGEEVAGSWRTDDGEIWLVATIRKGDLGEFGYRRYEFSRDGKGEIRKNGFVVSCEEAVKDKHHTLSFARR